MLVSEFSHESQNYEQESILNLT